MSQRKALIASIAITVILALSAIGFRATMGDSPAEAGSGEKQTAAISVASGANAGDSAFRQAGDDDQESDDDHGDDDDGDHDDWQYAGEHDDDEDEDDD